MEQHQALCLGFLVESNWTKCLLWRCIRIKYLITQTKKGFVIQRIMKDISKQNDVLNEGIVQKEYNVCRVNSHCTMTMSLKKKKIVNNYWKTIKFGVWWKLVKFLTFQWRISILNPIISKIKLHHKTLFDGGLERETQIISCKSPGQKPSCNA